MIRNPAWAGSDIQNHDSLFWVASRDRVAGEEVGDLGAVGYFVKRVQISGKSETFLFRYDLPFTATTVAAITADPQMTVSEAEIADLSNASDFADLRGIIAEGVLGLWVTFYDGNGDPIGSPSTRTPYDLRTDPQPAAIGIQIAVIDRPAATKMNALNFNPNPANSATPEDFLTTFPDPIRGDIAIMQTRVPLREKFSTP